MFTNTHNMAYLLKNEIAKGRGWIHALFLDQLRQLVSSCGGWNDDREHLRFAFEKAPKFMVGNLSLASPVVRSFAVRG